MGINLMRYFWTEVGHKYWPSPANTVWFGPCAIFYLVSPQGDIPFAAFFICILKRKIWNYPWMEKFSMILAWGCPHTNGLDYTSFTICPDVWSSILTKIHYQNQNQVIWSKRMRNAFYRALGILYISQVPRKKAGQRKPGMWVRRVGQTLSIETSIRVRRSA
jgi:hypothetical protein